MPDTQIKLAAFIKANNITMIIKRKAERPDRIDFGTGARHWLCILMSPTGEPMKLYFSQGSAHTKQPTISDVLDCLASDSSGVENARSFEEWASEYGYGVDSRKAESIYNACKKQSAELLALLGDDAYQTLLWNTERE